MIKKSLKKINKTITSMLSAILIISSALTINVQAATGNDIVNEAYRHKGKPYIYGATGPNSFDCSGFTQFVYRNVAGIDITRTTYSQINAGYPVSYSELQPGDLVFTYGLEHVGIYVGGGQYIHAPQPGDVVKVSPILEFYAARRISGISNLKNGWILSDGKWYWYDNGVMFKDNWRQIDEKWYFFSGNGDALIGWHNINGKRYHFGGNCQMAENEWRLIDGKWYYFQEDGDMFKGEWKEMDGKWYCFSVDGDALIGLHTVNGKKYHFRGNCQMTTSDWALIDGNWYYFQENGVMFTNNWKQIDGDWYCFSESGNALIGWQNINGKLYYFYGNCKMATNTTIDGWKIDSDGVATKL